MRQSRFIMVGFVIHRLEAYAARRCPTHGKTIGLVHAPATNPEIKRGRLEGRPYKESSLALPDAPGNDQIPLLPLTAIC
jgi:hypothetical protein